MSNNRVRRKSPKVQRDNHNNINLKYFIIINLVLMMHLD